MKSISVSKLYFCYNEEQEWILQNLSFQANAGEIIVIKGEIGVGKTTLLYNLCGVIPKTIQGYQKGSVEVCDKPIISYSLPELSTKICLLLQNPEQQLFFPKVEQELAFYPENLKVDANEINQRISEILHLLQIEHLRDRSTESLSYGEKKLVTFASLLTGSPKIFLLDEITTGISDNKIGLITSILKKLAEQGRTILIVDHLRDIAQISSKCIRLGNEK